MQLDDDAFSSNQPCTHIPVSIVLTGHIGHAHNRLLWWLSAATSPSASGAPDITRLFLAIYVHSIDEI
jgi:hypothetical protein